MVSALFQTYMGSVESPEFHVDDFEFDKPLPRLVTSSGVEELDDEEDFDDEENFDDDFDDEDDFDDFDDEDDDEDLDDEGEDLDDEE